MQLTAKEAAHLAYDREVLRLAKERLADLAEVTANDGYHMPDTYDGDRPQQSKRYELLTQRYRRGHSQACMQMFRILALCRPMQSIVVLHPG